MHLVLLLILPLIVEKVIFDDLELVLHVVILVAFNFDVSVDQLDFVPDSVHSA